MSLFEIPQEQPDSDLADYPDGAIRAEFESVADFNNYLSHYFSTFAGDPNPRFNKDVNNDLYILPAVTELSKQEVIRGLERSGLTWKEQTAYGDAVTLLYDNLSKGTGIYLGMDESRGYFFIYTSIPKQTYVDDVLLKNLKRLHRTSRLHVSSRKLEHLLTTEHTAQQNTENPDTVSNEIIFKRTAGSDVPSPVGHDDKRTINYYGDDAAQVVPHITTQLGMNVNSARLTVNDATFKINRDGVLKLETGTVNGMLTTLEQILEETLSAKQAYTDATTKVFEWQEKTISQAKPATVNFNADDNTHIEPSTIEDLYQALPEKGLVPIDRYLEPDPLYYSTTVYNADQQEYFDIRGDDTSLRLFPREGDRDLKTFFTVFEEIQDLISKGATVDVDSDQAPLEGIVNE